MIGAIFLMWFDVLMGNTAERYLKVDEEFYRIMVSFYWRLDELLLKKTGLSCLIDFWEQFMKIWFLNVAKH